MLSFMSWPSGKSSPFFRALDRLAVEDEHGGFRRLSRMLAYLPSQLSVNALQRTVFGPATEISVDAVPMRQILGQIAPRTADALVIEDGVEQFSVGMASRTTSGVQRLLSRNQMANQVPLLIGHVGRITSCTHEEIYDSYPFLNTL